MPIITGPLGRAAAALALVCAAAAPAIAQPKATPCLERQEAEDLIVFVLPTLIDGVGRKCRPLLPATAALVTQAPALAARHKPASDDAWPRAKGVVRKLMGESGGFLSDDVMRQVMQEVFTGAIVEQIKPKDCGAADRIVDALAPLPSRNMGQLVTLLLELGAAKENSPMRICPAGDEK